MTVGELKKQLARARDEYIVVLASDSEGNNFSPLYEVDVCKYMPDTTWSGDVRKIGNGIPNAVCLWPVN